MTPREELDLRRKLKAGVPPREELELRRQLQQAQPPAAAAAPPAQTNTPQTLQQRSKDAFGFKDYDYRGTLLPMGRTKEGKTELATPGIIRDMMESALLPGHVSEGGSYTPEDALRFTMDYAAPATAHKPSLTRQSMRKAAPTVAQLQDQARVFKGAAEGSGLTVKADSYLDMMANMESFAVKNKLDSGMYDKAHSAYKSLVKNLGGDLDVDDLIIARRHVTEALMSNDRSDQFAAGRMLDILDDFVNKLTPDDVSTGDPFKVGGNLAQFRSLWSRGKKAELIEKLIEKAGVSASGLENGLRTEFRSLVKKIIDEKVRGFSDSEVELMKDIASGGGATQKLLRLLGHMSFGTKGGRNWLGGTASGALGAGIGASIADGPGAMIGSMAPSVVGYGAQKGADAMAMNAANTARAAAALGGHVPRGGPQQGVFNLLMQGAMPGAGTLVPRPPSLMGNEFVRRHGLENVF